MSLASEVWKWGVRVRVCDADVDDAPDPGVSGGVEQDACLLNAAFVGTVAVVDTNPVSVEQRVRACKSLPQLVRATEVERISSHPIPEGTGALRVSGNRLDRMPLFKETSSNIASGVSGCSGYGMCKRFAHADWKNRRDAVAAFLPQGPLRAGGGVL